MTTTIARRPGALRIVAAVAALLLVSLVVTRASTAAFVAQDSNAGNAFEAATIGIDVDDSAPLFAYAGAGIVDTADMAPGDTVTGCLDVIYSGALTGSDLETVTIAATAATGNLAPALTIAIDVVDDTCAASAFTSADQSWGADAGIASFGTGWQPASDGDRRAFHFRVTFASVDDATDSGLMGETTDGVDVTWTVRSA